MLNYRSCQNISVCSDEKNIRSYVKVAQKAEKQEQNEKILILFSKKLSTYKKYLKMEKRELYTELYTLSTVFLCKSGA